MDRGVIIFLSYVVVSDEPRRGLKIYRNHK